jgi:hypothetical protein
MNAEEPMKQTSLTRKRVQGLKGEKGEGLTSNPLTIFTFNPYERYAMSKIHRFEDNEAWQLASDLSCDALAKREAVVKKDPNLWLKNCSVKKIFIARGSDWNRGILNQDEVIRFSKGVAGQSSSPKSSV